jgi:gamma-glutamyltranspeptidase/glutathione hydrolase
VDAPRLHHQWQPDVLFAEPFALSPDSRVLLEQMGYHIEEQRQWGAVALIASGTLRSGRSRSGAADSVATHAAGPAVYFGANDPRRPAGAALAP